MNADPEAQEYDVALSFAGEDREYVDSVADSLRSRGVSVFYDRYEAAALWGKDLYVHLRDVYSRRSKYTVLFASRYYAQKLWTNHERVSAQERAFSERREFILPARFDDTVIPGLPGTVGYIDLRHTSPEDLAGLIEEKLHRYQRTEPGNGRAKGRRVRDVLWGVLEAVERDMVAGPTGLRTGFSGIDGLINGMMPGDFYVLAGNRDVARNFGFQCILNMALEDSTAAAVVTMRRRPEEVVEAMLGLESMTNVRSRAIDDEGYKRLGKAAGILAGAPIYVLHQPRTWQDLRADIREYAASSGLRALLIENLADLSRIIPGVSRPSAVLTLAHSLQAEAEELDLVLIVVADDWRCAKLPEFPEHYRAESGSPADAAMEVAEAAVLFEDPPSVAKGGRAEIAAHVLGLHGRASGTTPMCVGRFGKLWDLRKPAQND